jgi:hypothetical protein
MEKDLNMTKSDQTAGRAASGASGIVDSDNPNPQSETADQVETLVETGGPKGLEPTRFGDWEKNGRCSDF